MGAYIVIVLVSFFASVIGAICGIGGGVIIKPVLDSTGIIPVDTISFLSGCTVLSMSVISVIKNLKRTVGEVGVAQRFDKRLATVLACGAALGGVIGKNVYQSVLSRMPHADTVGAVQASVLLVITVGTLVYTLKKEQIRTLQVSGNAMCLLIGLTLGIMSSFLGIGGGPINLVVLFYFFSMGTKQAAEYSLYIIMFSQIASLVNSIATGKVPSFSLVTLILMICCGMGGGLAGARVNKKIKEKTVDKLFIVLMIVIILINIYNIFKYT